jgi:hypothetical protein
MVALGFPFKHYQPHCESAGEGVKVARENAEPASIWSKSISLHIPSPYQLLEFGFLGSVFLLSIAEMLLRSLNSTI